MNEHVRPPKQRQPTQAAEGLPRWRWTTEELVRLTALGVFTDYDRFELIGGEIVPMSPKGNRDEVVRNDIAHELAMLGGRAVKVSGEAQFNLTDDTYVVPDILVYSSEEKASAVRGGTVLLVIEVADTSLANDLGWKARHYASYGVREYWVIEAQSLNTHVHREPSEAGYGRIKVAGPRAKLTALLVPELSLKLGELEL